MRLTMETQQQNLNGKTEQTFDVHQNETSQDQSRNLHSRNMTAKFALANSDSGGDDDEGR